MDIIKKITNFLFELNVAKLTPRRGWQKIGVKYPESIAEHSALAAQIAFVLAQMENANAERATTLALFHDIGEIRVGDNDWVSRIYQNKNDAEEKAFKAQISRLPAAQNLQQLFGELKAQKTKEAVIAKDADLLELAIQAKVYAESGYRTAPLFIDGMRHNLKTESAKKLFAAIEKNEIADWWLAIPEIAAIAKNIFKNKKSK